MSELARHLRRTTEQMACSAKVDMSLWNEHSNACLDSANAVERLTAERDALRAQLDEAREALEPFADMLMSYDASKRGWMLSECRPKIGALRRARAVLEKIKGGGDE